MTKVFALTKKELGYILLSPIGWIVVSLLFAIAALRFVGTLDLYFEQSIIGRSPSSWSYTLFTFQVQTVFATVIQNAYLFAPLITMAVFSREIQTGSIKLLLSAPASPSSLVFGKYLGVMVFLFLLLLPLVLLVAISTVIVPHFDYVSVLPGFIGLFLLLSTYAAIGVFISSLSQYQVLSAIVTLTILFALQSASRWLQDIPVLNEFFYWISLSGRADSFRSGLVSTDNILYFLSIISIFLALCAIRLSALRNGLGLSLGLVKPVAFIFSVIAIGWVLSLPRLSSSYDFTYPKRNSLSPETAMLVERIDGPWRIDTYANIVDRMGDVSFPRSRISDKARYNRFRRINGQLQMEYHPFFDWSAAAASGRSRLGPDQDGLAIANRYAKSVGFDPDEVPAGEELATKLDVDLEEEGFRTIRVVRWNDSYSILRYFDDNDKFPDERVQAAALKSLIDGPQNVLLLTANSERSAFRNSDSDLQLAFTERNNRYSLINHGFNFVSSDVANSSHDKDDILVIADPKEAYEKPVLDKISEHLAIGGNMLFLLEETTHPSIDEILGQLGIRRGKTLSWDNEGKFANSFILGRIAASKLDPYWGNSSFMTPLALSGAIELEVGFQENGFWATPFITAKRNSSVEEYHIEVIPFDDETEAVVGWKLNRSVGDKTQTILVLGDGDVFSNAALQRTSPRTSQFLHWEVFYNLSNMEYPVSLTTKAAIDNSIQIDRMGIKYLRWVLVALVPLIIGLFGIYVIHRRRSK